MFKNNLVLAYITLVGLPLLALFGVLEAGRSLTAPPAVAGEWAVEFDRAPVAMGCLENLPEPVLTIAQSGSTLVITLNDSRKTEFAGALQNSLFSATASAGDSKCGHAPIRLDVTVSGMLAQRTLHGHFAFDGCAACPPVVFRAVRPNSMRKRV